MTKKKEIEDFDFNSYGIEDLTINQKLAVINFMSVIAVSDTKKGDSPIRKAYISFYYKEFGITGDQFLAYISIGGREQTIEDLKSLTKSNMQDLVYMTTEMFICDNKNASDEELIALSNWLTDIGMTIEEWNDYLEHPGDF
jgi:hypothetical protein